MKVTYRLANITFEKECATRKDAYAFVGAIGEAFPSEPCGCCKSTNTGPIVSTWEDKTFHKMKCNDCGAELMMVFWKAVPAENKAEKFFAQRKDKDKKLKPNRGWEIYRKDGAPAESAQSGNGESGGDESVIPF